MSLAIGPLTRLFTKHMHVFIESRYSWDTPKILSFELIDELKFWLSNLEDSNGLKMRYTPQVTKIVYSDASNNSYGGFLIQELGQVIARGDFHNHEVETSSTSRELLAVKYVLQSFAHNLQSNACSGSQIITTFPE